jgi:HTH-type transcriptional regulator/antitoxin HipB
VSISRETQTRHFVPAAALFSQELGIRYIDLTLSRIQNMDYELITTRLGKQIRQRRLNRGMTQARLAELARVTRQKVIAIEKGDLSVGMTAYARVLAALNCELTVIPAVLPTLDEIHGIFD